MYECQDVSSDLVSRVKLAACDLMHNTDTWHTQKASGCLRPPDSLPPVSIHPLRPLRGRQVRAGPVSASVSPHRRPSRAAAHWANTPGSPPSSRSKQDTPRCSWPRSHLPGEDVERRVGWGGHGSQAENKRIILQSDWGSQMLKGRGIKA